MSKIKALIIDDNPSNISVLRHLLTLENVDVISFDNVNDLTERLDGIPDVRVIFLDLEFPRSNGYEAFNTIKSHPYFKNVSIIAYSVHLNEFNTVSELGFDGFLGKPLSTEEFPEQWQQILRGEKVWYTP